MPRAWYSFNNASTGSPTPDLDPANYDLIPILGLPVACRTGNQVCAIYAAYSGTTAPSNPILSSRIQNYVIASRLKNVPQPENFPTYLYKKTF